MFISPISPVTVSNLQINKRNSVKDVNNTSFGMARNYKTVFRECAEHNFFEVSSACHEMLQRMKLDGRVLRKDIFDLFTSGVLRTTMRRLTENNEPALASINEEAEGYGVEIVRGPENSVATYINAGRQNAGFFARLTGDFAPDPQIVFTGPGNYNHIQLNISYDTNSKLYQVTKFNSKTGETSYFQSNS